MANLKDDLDWKDALKHELEKLRKSDKNIAKQSIDNLVKDFVKTIANYISPSENFITSQQVQILSDQVKDLKEKISCMSEAILKDESIPEVAVELQYVVEQTEKSVMGILDIAEEVNLLSKKISDNIISAQLKNHSVRILELCNFQDLTGQIIGRIIKRLTNIELVLDKIAKALGEETFFNHSPKAEINLLHGPQKEEERPSQNDIDELFCSLDKTK